jgi:hypothetical protein
VPTAPAPNRPAGAADDERRGEAAHVAGAARNADADDLGEHEAAEHPSVERQAADIGNGRRQDRRHRHRFERRGRHGEDKAESQRAARRGPHPAARHGDRRGVIRNRH